MLETVAPEEPGDPDDDVVPELAPAQVQPGDTSQLGRHRLVCGDAPAPNVIAALMDSEDARTVFSKPTFAACARNSF